MLITVSCKSCGQRFVLPEESAGRRTVCRICGSKLKIPNLSLVKRVRKSISSRRSLRIIRTTGLLLGLLLAGIIVVWVARGPNAETVRSRVYQELFADSDFPFESITLQFEGESLTKRRGPPSVIESCENELCFDASGRFLRKSKYISSTLDLQPEIMAYDGSSCWTQSIGGSQKVIRQRLDASVLKKWVLSGFWCHPAARVHVSHDAARTTKEHFALSISALDGPSFGTIIIDRKNCRPISCEFEMAADETKIAFQEYQNTQVGKFLKTYEVREGTRAISRVNVLSFTPEEKKADSFFSQPGRDKTPTYANHRKARLKTSAGPWGRLLVPTQINGHDVGLFLFDTGAFRTTVYDSAAQRAGLTLPKLSESDGVAIGPRFGYRTHFATSVEVGPIRLSNAEINMIAAPNGMENEGVIGCDILEHTVVEFDARHQRLVLHSPTSFKAPENVEWLPFILDNSPGIEVTLAGSETKKKFMLDTGAPGELFAGSDLSHSVFKELRGDFGVVRGFAGGGSAIIESKLDRIRFGTQPVSDVAVILDLNDDLFTNNPYLDGLIGVKIMSQFKIIFDFPNRRVALIRHPS